VTKLSYESERIFVRAALRAGTSSKIINEVYGEERQGMAAPTESLYLSEGQMSQFLGYHYNLLTKKGGPEAAFRYLKSSD
jgi:hypothetical protein